MLVSTIRQFGAYALDVGGQAAFGFLIVFFAARSASVEEFGLLAAALAISGVQQPLALFGMQQVAYGRAAAGKSSAPPLLWQAMVFSIYLGVFLYAVTLLIVGVLQMQNLFILYALSGLRVLTASRLVLTADAQGRRKVREYLYLRGLTIMWATIAATAAYIWGAPIWVYAAAWGFEALAYSGAMLLNGTAKKRLKKQGHARYRVLLARAAPIAAQSIFVILYLRFDQIYIQYRFGEAELAIYAAAAKVAEAGNLSFQVIVLTFAPTLIRELKLIARLSFGMKTVLVGIAAVSVIGCALCWLWGGLLLEILFGAPYGSGRVILATYILSTCFVGYGGLASKALAAFNSGYVQAVSGLAGALTNVVLTVWWCEQFGSVGAAWATVVSYGVAVSILVLGLAKCVNRTANAKVPGF